MNISRRLTLCAGSTFALLVQSGCSSPPAQYYRLAPTPGTPLAGGPPVVDVRSISIPGYLNQNGIAKQGSNVQFGVYANDLWPEPLADMLQSVLVQNLAQRLNQSTVLASGDSIGLPPDMLVEVNVLRFDPDDAGKIFLNAQIAVRMSRSQARWVAETIVHTESAGPAVADIVAAMTALWGIAADETARLVVNAWAARPEPAAF